MNPRLENGDIPKEVKGDCSFVLQKVHHLHIIVDHKPKVIFKEKIVNISHTSKIEGEKQCLFFSPKHNCKALRAKQQLPGQINEHGKM